MARGSRSPAYWYSHDTRKGVTMMDPDRLVARERLEEELEKSDHQRSRPRGAGFVSNSARGT